MIIDKLIKYKPNSKKTEVVDQHDKKHKLNLKQWPFLPNFAYKEMFRILTNKSQGINIIFDTAYHNQHKHMSHFKKGRFKPRDPSKLLDLIESFRNLASRPSGVE